MSDVPASDMMNWIGKRLDEDALKEAARKFVVLMKRGAPKEMGVVLLLVNQVSGKDMLISDLDADIVKLLLRDKSTIAERRIVRPM